MLKSSDQPIPADPSWTPLEAWVWKKVQVGDVANLDDYQDDRGRLPPADPRKSEEWQDGRRRLTARFLDDILLREPFRSARYRKRVFIESAWFNEYIDLGNADFTDGLLLDRCRFERPVEGLYLRTTAPVSFEGSAFAAQLDLTGVKIDADPIARSGAFRDIILAGSKIGGQIDLTGANIAGALDIGGAEIGRNLAAHRAEFHDVMLRGARVGGQINMSSAKVDGRVDMNGAEIGSLLMRSEMSAPRAAFNDIDLRGAKIGVQLTFIGSYVAGKLDMNGVDIRGGLLMASHGQVSEHRAEFSDVDLTGARVGGQVALIGVKISGKLDMNGVVIGGSLLMRSDQNVSHHRAEFKDVVLIGAKVGGQVALIGAKVAGTLDLSFVEVDESLLLNSYAGVSEHLSEFDGAVILVFAKLGSGLDLRGAALSALDLSGASIGGELTLASPSLSPKWQSGAQFRLRNTSVDVIQDTSDEGVWPEPLELGGFAYKRFGGLAADTGASVAKRGSPWFINWLGKDKPYTPQPYQQCAKVLREMGHPEMAKDVLYAGRERERKEALQLRTIPRWSGLTLLKWTIGYGYGSRLLWRPLSWAVGLIVVGMFLPEVVRLMPEMAGDPSGWCADSAAWTATPCFEQQSLGWRFWFSLDMLLPIVELSREHTIVQAGLDGLAYGWFALQRLLGWVLALFLVAGLSGLTK